MPSKSLTIKESTYDRLAALKMVGESFSDLLDRLASRNGVEAMRRMRGALDLEPGEGEEIIAEIRAARQVRRYG